MSERKTEITINVYSGVPFNSKYQNVLFVSRETLATYLAQFEIGQTITANRFEIVDETQAIIDLTNDFECMNANYCKVHRKIIPETNEDIYEYDSYYFVTRARQIATNVIRLYLELDVFQTYFNKYDYQAKMPVIPEIKKSRCVVSTDFPNLVERTSILDATHFNNYELVKPLFPQTNVQYKTVRAILHFTTTTGEFTAVSKNDFGLYPAKTPIPNLGSLITSIYSAQEFFVLGNLQKITVLDFYLVPNEFLAGGDFSTFSTGYYKYKNALGQDSNMEFFVSTAITSGVSTEIPIVEVSNTKTYTPEIYKCTSVGTFTKRIDLPYNSKSYHIRINCCFNNKFQIFMYANNQMLEITDEFTYNILKSDYAQFLQQNKATQAIKQISDVITLVGLAASAFTGNKFSVPSALSKVENVAGEVGAMIDLKNQPLKVNGNSNCATNIQAYNGIGIFENTPENAQEIVNTEKYFGYKMNCLEDKKFEYENLTENSTIRHNFNFYQFTNVEIVGKLPENFKSRIEQMFLDGIRIWLHEDKFLNTIENKEKIEKGN